MTSGLLRPAHDYILEIQTKARVIITPLFCKQTPVQKTRNESYPVGFITGEIRK